VIAAHEKYVRGRRGPAVVAATLALMLAVAWAHSGMAMDHMGTPMAVCVAIADGGLLVGAATVLAPALSLRLPTLIDLGAPGMTAVRGPALRAAPARASPPVLQVFRL
jgi:hypothetical protein